MTKEIDIKDLDKIAAGRMDDTLTELEVYQILIQLTDEQICSLYCRTYPNGYKSITSKQLEEVIKGYFGLEAEGGVVKDYNDTRQTDVIVKR